MKTSDVLHAGMTVQRTFDPREIEQYSAAAPTATQGEIGLITRIQHDTYCSYYVVHWPSSGSADMFYAIPEAGQSGYIKRAAQRPKRTA